MVQRSGWRGFYSSIQNFAVCRLRKRLDHFFRHEHRYGFFGQRQLLNFLGFALLGKSTGTSGAGKNYGPGRGNRDQAGKVGLTTDVIIRYGG